MRHGYRNIFMPLAMALPCGLTGCQQGGRDDRDQIQQGLQRMVKVVENRQVSDFLDVVHQDFQGQGSLRKAAIAGDLQHHFQLPGSISVWLSEAQIQLAGRQQATVTLTVQIDTQAGLGQGRRLHLQNRWLKNKERWLVERARWQVTR